MTCYIVFRTGKEIAIGKFQVYTRQNLTDIGIIFVVTRAVKDKILSDEQFAEEENRQRIGLSNDKERY